MSKYLFNENGEFAAPPQAPFRREMDELWLFPRLTPWSKKAMVCSASGI
ncbi:hypothetical protein PZN02_000252 [Sinorhizobium garamanticum]|uniref:Uncharacterized protein n=1 Tax=Sinorhizobium garamanticum TaxID=680247 RepID=A0ABY8DE60_9HYPH|nr:hypothetical protein [Sinorhizobium garamanticum]WEX87820.1 hypothetical protein PZN02_000252 [Sinorhizobium garamanticum]